MKINFLPVLYCYLFFFASLIFVILFFNTRSTRLCHVCLSFKANGLTDNVHVLMFHLFHDCIYCFVVLSISLDQPALVPCNKLLSIKIQFCWVLSWISFWFIFCSIICSPHPRCWLWRLCFKTYKYRSTYSTHVTFMTASRFSFQPSQKNGE